GGPGSPPERSRAKGVTSRAWSDRPRRARPARRATIAPATDHAPVSIQLVPVLDLKAGLAVHAVRGERDRYAPVRSVLAPSADHVALASAFRAALGCQACYVADLDAITGAGDNGAVIRAIAALGLAVWLDAGVARAAAARALACGAQRVIVGTETLRDPGELPAIVTALEAAAAGTGPRPAAR